MSLSATHFILKIFIELGAWSLLLSCIKEFDSVYLPIDDNDHIFMKVMVSSHQSVYENRKIAIFTC